MADINHIRFQADLSVKKPKELLRAWEEGTTTASPSLMIDLKDVYYVRPFAATLIFGIIVSRISRNLKVEVRSPLRSNAKHQLAFLWSEAIVGFSQDDMYRGPGIPLFLIKPEKGDPARDVLNLIVGQVPALPPSVRSLTYLSLNECIENILTHAGNPFYAAVSANVIPTKQRIRISLFDAGIGILHSLKKNSKYSELADHGEAICLALEKGVTGRSESRRGMGLYVLSKFVRRNEGSLHVISGNAMVAVDNAGLRTEYYKNYLTGTSINIELIRNNPFDFTIEEELEGVESVF